MWRPQLEQYEREDGSIQKIGWTLVNYAGQPFADAAGAIVTGFTREEMLDLAQQHNGAPGGIRPRS